MSKELMQKKIAEAQKAIDEVKEKVSKGKMRQRYHFMAEAGWINDPNGLIFYKGKYHYFYQYNPYYGFWDSMHWGHAVSEDLLHWEFLPLALAPSEIYDDHLRGGCFSGSAIVHEDKLYVLFTGTTNEGKGFEQAQCVAWSEDGIHFEKYDGNPVITAPEGIPTDFFRDPKVWKHEDTYYMVLGASKNKMGQALLYRSKDLLEWEFFNVLAESRGEWGYMWECPDFYPVGDKYVLMFSPMGGGERTSVYLVGDFSYETGKFNYTVSGEIDWGFDFYAPQSFLAPDGRRLIVGWANAWDWMPHWKDWGPAYKEGWCGFYNIPREVKLMPDHTLQFIPIKEMESIRENEQIQTDIAVGTDPVEITAGDGVAYELKMNIDLEKTNASGIILEMRCGEGKKTTCTVNLKQGELTVDRNEADGWSCGVSRSPLYLAGQTNYDMHIYSDQSSLEIFTNNYQTNHAINIFAGNEQNKIYIYTVDGTAIVKDMCTYGLKKTM